VRGHLQAQPAEARCDGRTEARVIVHQADAPEDARRFRSVDPIERTNDRLSDCVGERIYAKAFGRCAEENRVVLVSDHETLLRAECDVKN
jgi:hypothetical protein